MHSPAGNFLLLPPDFESFKSLPSNIAVNIEWWKKA